MKTACAPPVAKHIATNLLSTTRSLWKSFKSIDFLINIILFFNVKMVIRMKQEKKQRKALKKQKEIEMRKALASVILE